MSGFQHFGTFLWDFGFSHVGNRVVTVHQPGQLHQIKNESNGLKIFMSSSSSVLIALVVLRVSYWILSF